MATWKFSIKRGQPADKAVLGAGTTISGSDAIELNVDATNMTRAEFETALEELRIATRHAKFPAA